MLGPDAIEAYRRMTPSERLRLTLAAAREAVPYLLYGPPDVVERRFTLMRCQKDERNRCLRERLGAAEGRVP